MPDKKEPQQRLGSLNSGGPSKNPASQRLGGLNGAGGSGTGTAGTRASRLKFKPKNFQKSEPTPVSEEKPPTVEQPPQDGPSRRRDNIRTGPGRSARSRPPLPHTHYSSEVVFGGVVGVGGSGKNAGDQPTNLRKPKSEPQAPTHRLVKASAIAASKGGKSEEAGPNKSKLKSKKSDIDNGDVLQQYEDSDEENSDDSGTSADDGQFFPPDTNPPKLFEEIEMGSDGRSFAKAPEAPLELMSRAPESETVLNQELAALVDPEQDDRTGLMLFQLPSVLPLPAPLATNSSGEINLVNGDEAGPSNGNTKEEESTKKSRPASLAELPPMKIGKLFKLRNGAVKMQIGDVVFDVSPGVPLKMRQEYANVDSMSKQITVLGEIERRVVVTPNLDSLLSDEPPQWKYAAEAERGGEGGGEGAGKQQRKKKDKIIIIDSDDDDEEEEEEEAANGVAPMVIDGEVKDEEEEVAKPGRSRGNRKRG